MIHFTYLIVKMMVQLLLLDNISDTDSVNLYLIAILYTVGQTPIIEQKFAGTNLTCDIIAKQV